MPTVEFYYRQHSIYQGRGREHQTVGIAGADLHMTVSHGVVGHKATGN